MSGAHNIRGRVLVDMKKNLVSIIILALTIVNTVLLFIIMLSTTGAIRNINSIVGDVATVLSLELESEDVADEISAVPIEDVVLHNIADDMIIPIKTGEDGENHFVQLKISFMLNSKHDDYSKYSKVIADKDPIIKDAVIGVFATKSVEEVTNEQKKIKKEILENVQAIFGSEFIFDVSFSEITPQ